MVVYVLCIEVYRVIGKNTENGRTGESRLRRAVIPIIASFVRVSECFARVVHHKTVGETAVDFLFLSGRRDLDDTTLCDL
jgi:hypothetical protein